MAKFLDETGLAYFWERVKSYFNTIIPTKVSDLSNDIGYISSYTETDPTVPSWAKAENKPTYTASEVGALSAVVSSGSGNVVTDLSVSNGVITYTLGNASTTAAQIIRDSSTTDINTLKIHYLSQADYIDAVNQGLINPNEFYITPETTQ